MELMDIIQSIDNNMEKVRTKSLDLSFNELLDMYENEELIIDPDYQRLFRWDNDKQSRFIESLILEMPVPPIFVIETSDNVYELIDGLQRISSYLHFRGITIKDGEKKEDDFLELEGCDIIKDINRLTYNDLPKSIQIRLKRNFIRVEVLRKQSDEMLRYHMFKRLNTGGEQLSNQEVRNCTIRLLDDKFIDFIIRCSNYDNFRRTISRIKESDISKKLDQELVLRFFALKNNLDEYKYPFDEYLTKYMEQVSKGEKEFNYEEEEKIFKLTFDALYEVLEEEVFSSILSTGVSREDFILYFYDAFSLGIQEYADKIMDEEIDVLKVTDCLHGIKVKNELKPYRTGSKSNIIKRVDYVKEKLGEL